MEAYTTADLFAFVDIPGRDLPRPELENVRTAFRIRNLTNAVYAAFVRSGLSGPDLSRRPAHLRSLGFFQMVSRRLC